MAEIWQNKGKIDHFMANIADLWTIIDNYRQFKEDQTQLLVIIGDEINSIHIIDAAVALCTQHYRVHSELSKDNVIFNGSTRIY